jgi:hypothetical protein
MEEKMTGRNRNSSSRHLVTAILLPSFFGLAFLGCGGSTSSTSPIPAKPGTTIVQINLGDSPSDWIVAFTMSLGSIALTDANGGNVSVASGAMQMEMRHLMGTMQPVAMTSVPHGTYSMATLNISSVSVTYIDPVTKLAVQKTMPGRSATINFSPPIKVGSTPTTMNFELDLARSVSTDAGGNMVFGPVFNTTLGMPGNGQGPEYGGVEHMLGSVSGVSGSSFTMSIMQGLPGITLMTNSTTQFGGMGGMGSLNNGMMVEVDAKMQPDGAFMATRIDSVMSGMPGGMMAEGLITSLNGNPPTQLSIIADNGAGNGMMGSYLGTPLLVNVTSSTSYGFDASGVDLNNLPFTPAFNPSTIGKGQRVDPETSGSMMVGATMNAAALTLEQQGLSGTVASYASGSPASFVLNLPVDSAFTSITGAGTIIVIQQPDTQLRGLTSISNGASVQVRGLLFVDAGTYKMVATRIMSH